MDSKKLPLQTQSFHPLIEIWEHTQIFHREITKLKSPPLKKVFSDFIAVGPYYHYTIDVASGTIRNVHENILKMHGIQEIPNTLSEIIALIHPDDLHFVLEAERMCYEKVQEIGREHLLQLKTSYCFRMQTDKNKYELFHHQAIHTHITEEIKVAQTINIHTNIQHITSCNNYTALVTGIGERDDFYQIQFLSPNRNQLAQRFTKREIEIIKLIANGFNTRKISELLNISHYTVETHRKKILGKTECRNSSELTRMALEQGII
ncbi:response regulator transcription factor [Kaistella montana]|uniref:Response regulator transcription factor n=1 Tax=Kaistella montana TaxID=1849733 RepID=A0ABW5K9W5_9FLAO|nr:LuxR C-terminal-related transcriptional regulator [Kaistella montana]MCQ4035482.1 LuxR C-terminal-related transcriptional regulator [Kaistella montana]